MWDQPDYPGMVLCWIIEEEWEWDLGKPNKSLLGGPVKQTTLKDTGIEVRPMFL